MSSNNVSVITLNNPAIFMTKTFLEKILLTNKFSKGQIIPIIKNEVPKLIIIKFSEESLINEFISQYNNKPISNELNYILSLTKTNKTIEELQKEYENIKDLTPVLFYEDYENDWKNNYTNSPEKSGLLYIDEEKKMIIYNTVKYLVSKMGKNILHGKSVLNISFPVFIFDKRTLQSAFAYELKNAPI